MVTVAHRSNQSRMEPRGPALHREHDRRTDLASAFTDRRRRIRRSRCNGSARSGGGPSRESGGLAESAGWATREQCAARVRLLDGSDGWTDSDMQGGRVDELLDAAV